MKLVWEVVCREPYRLFFPLGALLGILGVGHWLVYGLGWIPAYSGHYHAFTQTSLYMGCFATGFLTTAIPKFSDTWPASRLEVLVLLMIIIATSISLNRENFIGAEALAAILWVALLFFIGRRFQKRSVKNPPIEFMWLPFAFLHGIVGHLIVTLSLSGVISETYFFIGRPMAEQGFLLALVSGIGGFLGPRLIGAPVIIPDSLSEIALVRRNTFRLFLTLAGALFITFCFPTTNKSSWVYFSRAFVITIVLIWNRALLFYWPASKGFLAKMMAVSFWMIVLGLWLCAFFPAYKTAMLHFVFLGGFSLMTFGVSTMVMFSHSGEGEKLNKSAWVLRVILWGIVIALILRITAVFSGANYFSWLAAAAFFWVLTAIAWLCFTARLLFKAPDFSAFDSHHQQMKERMTRSC